MVMSAVRYAFEEAFVSLWRGRQAGVVSIGTIALSLFVLGCVLMTTSNLQRLADELGRSAELSIYVPDDAAAADRAGLEQLLAQDPLVDRVEFVSKDEALARFKQTFASLGDIAATVEGNPLPASYEVRLRSTGSQGEAVGQFATRLRSMPGVDDVRYDRVWLDRILAMVSGVRTVGLLLGGVLALAAALTVANVVRLSLHERRQELDIMELVGAPWAYVRGPFVMEGILQGGAGAIGALAGLGLGFLGVRARFLLPLAEAVNLPGVRFLSLAMCVGLVAGGMVVGCLGGLVAGWRRR